MSKKGRFNMSLSLSERQPIIRESAKQYKKAGKKEKSRILDKFLDQTERSDPPKKYSRKYAAWLLRNTDRKIYTVLPNGKPMAFVAKSTFRRRKRKPKYEPIVRILEWLWQVSGFLCSRRLKIFIRDNLSGIRTRKEYTRDINNREFNLLMSISAASIDRHLKAYRQKHQLKGRSYTKPGTLLKHKIPVRHYGDWPDLPGYMEVDLVAHDGGNSSGDFNHTLTMTDVFTTWTHLVVLPNKAHKWVFEGLKKASLELPFPMHGLDSDCGGEFINHALFKHCKNNGIEFTRARAGRKNDNCYVEQKNWSIVRKLIGYDRFDSETSYRLLRRLYKSVNLYTNHFQPTEKLLEKIRIGNRTIKKYSVPETPYSRVLSCPEILPAAKNKLRKQHASLSPVVLHQKIERCQMMLLKLAKKRCA